MLIHELKRRSRQILKQIFRLHEKEGCFSEKPSMEMSLGYIVINLNRKKKSQWSKGRRSRHHPKVESFRVSKQSYSNYTLGQGRWCLHGTKQIQLDFKGRLWRVRRGQASIVHSDSRRPQRNLDGLSSTNHLRRNLPESRNIL
ncbi:hypothetical protein RRG08_063086 [Elysia crispata]|uniref:Uncharacterized protein n=1 Tax=Elysia crispata TaxID=231223 RepID=A0AAE0ZB42_9GAST|nr:hypothetical protein RRG08_063086 [Elysia crispata]